MTYINIFINLHGPDALVAARPAHPGFVGEQWLSARMFSWVPDHHDIPDGPTVTDTDLDG